MFQQVPGGTDDLYMINMDTGSSFALGDLLTDTHYDFASP